MATLGWAFGVGLIGVVVGFMWCFLPEACVVVGVVVGMTAGGVVAGDVVAVGVVAGMTAGGVVAGDVVVGVVVGGAVE